VRVTGYVKDDEKIDPDPLLESIRKGTEASNEQRKSRGWSTLTIVGWKLPPRYDTQDRRLEWAIDARSDGGAVVNYNTRVLGRHGVTSVTLVDCNVRIRSDAMRRVTVYPLHGIGCVVVLADVAHELSP